MIKPVLSLACALFTSLSIFAQTDVQMNIIHKSGDENFEYGMTMTNNMGYDYNVSRLEYYLSDFVLVHDGNNETPVDDLVVLANGENVYSIIMGSLPVSNLEYLKFQIGVNPDLNHLDPSTYAPENPLAPQLPSMHWGWASGYKFVAIEGMVNDENSYEFHGLGDNNYFEVEVPVDIISDSGFLEINLLADVGHILENINLSTDLISHGETGNARTVLQNMRDYVFVEYNSTVGLSENELAESVAIYPNPSSNGTTNILFQSDSNKPYQIAIFDILGKEVKRITNLQPNVQNEISLNKTGLYLFNIQTTDGGLVTKKVIVQ